MVRSLRLEVGYSWPGCRRALLLAVGEIAVVKYHQFFVDSFKSHLGLGALGWSWGWEVLGERHATSSLADNEYC